MAFEYYNKQMRIQALNCTQKLTVVDGGLTVTAGGLTVTAGGATVTAGGLTVTAGGVAIAAGSLKARGYDTTVPSLIQKFPDATAPGASHQTITIAEILTGLLVQDPGGASTWTLPTAALAVAGVTGVAVGDCIDFTVINLDATKDIAITIAAGTDGTIVGNAEVESPSTTAEKISTGSAIWRIRFDVVASGSEEYTAYRMA